MPQAIHRRCLLNGLVMTMSELKVCPFCGGEAEIERHGTARASMIIACGQCGCRIESGNVSGFTSDEFLSWNLRDCEARIRREVIEECAVMFDREADEMEAGWNEFLAPGSNGPATSYRGIWRHIAAKVRALAEESPDA